MSFHEFLYPVGSFVGVVLVTWIIAHLLGSFFGRILKRGPPLIATHIKRLSWIFVWSIGILFALQQLGLRIDLLLLLVALFGGTMVLANKETLQNVASKYFSDVYIPFKLGDSIRVNDYAGRVIEINPISTILITDNEELISVPNGLFLREIMVNTTPHAWKEVTVPIIIGSELDLAEFESDVLKSCNKLKLHFDERFPPILTVRNKEQRSTELVLRLMVKDPGTKDTIVSVVNSKVGEIIEKMKRKK